MYGVSGAPPHPWATASRSPSRTGTDTSPIAAPFRHRHFGVLDAEDLAGAYTEAAVGMVLSTTNPSLVGHPTNEEEEVRNARPRCDSRV